MITQSGPDPRHANSRKSLRVTQKVIESFSLTCDFSTMIITLYDGIELDSLEFADVTLQYFRNFRLLMVFILYILLIRVASKTLTKSSFWKFHSKMILSFRIGD